MWSTKSGVASMVYHASSENSEAQTVASHLGFQIYVAGTTALTPPKKESMVDSIHKKPSGYTKIPALLALLRYATKHNHSQFWIGAITVLLQREELADEW